MFHFIANNTFLDVWNNKEVTIKLGYVNMQLNIDELGF